MIRKPYLVHCSCGDTCIVKFDENKQEYVPADPHWRYNPQTNWNCGKRGHHKARAVALDPVTFKQIDYDRPMISGLDENDVESDDS